MKTIVTYNNGDIEEFPNRTKFTFWEDCKRIMEVETIKEVE